MYVGQKTKKWKVSLKQVHRAKSTYYWWNTLLDIRKKSVHIIIYKSRLQCCPEYFFSALWRVYFPNHNVGICSITCDGITSLRLPEEVCLHTTNRTQTQYTNTHTHTVLSAGFVLQSHAIYNIGPAGLYSSCMNLLQAAREREREKEKDEEEEGERGSLPSGFCCTGCSLHGNIALSCNQIKECDQARPTPFSMDAVVAFIN